MSAMIQGIRYVVRPSEAQKIALLRQLKAYRSVRRLYEGGQFVSDALKFDGEYEHGKTKFFGSSLGGHAKTTKMVADMSGVSGDSAGLWAGINVSMAGHSHKSLLSAQWDNQFRCRGAAAGVEQHENGDLYLPQLGGANSILALHGGVKVLPPLRIMSLLFRFEKAGPDDIAITVDLEISGAPKRPPHKRRNFVVPALGTVL